MLRSLVRKVLWVGRSASTVFGLALVLALILGAATAALGATGGNFVLGGANTAGAVSKLTANIADPALQLVNTSTGSGATALNLQVAGGKPPMRVNSSAKVANLNADQIDGKDFGAFGAQEAINQYGPLPIEQTFTSKGGTLIISASGSGFRSSSTTQHEGYIGMVITIDGQPEESGSHYAGSGIIYANERDSHKAFVSPSTVVRGLPAGTHTIRVDPSYDNACNTFLETTKTFCTSTNGDDVFNATVEEMPN